MAVLFSPRYALSCSATTTCPSTQLTSMHNPRTATVVLSFLGAIGNFVLATHLLALYRILKSEPESEWEGSSSLRIDGLKIVTVLTTVYFTLAALACIVGFIGAAKVRQALVCDRGALRDEPTLPPSCSAYLPMFDSSATCLLPTSPSLPSPPSSLPLPPSALQSAPSFAMSFRVSPSSCAPLPRRVST